MSEPRSARLSRLSGAFLLAGWLACAHAAELGDAAVHSYLGQPLVADIEITAMADPALPVRVHLASADVYRGANIAMPAVLSSLNMSTMRRDGRQFLHLTSLKPIEADHLNLFLDLTDGARRNVRAVTLWLAPDPQPAPPPAPVPVPVPAPPPLPTPLPVAAPEPAPAPAVAALPRMHPAAAVCPQINAEQLRTCAALDYKNGLLSARIVELEEKVKALQAAIEGRADAATVPAPVAVIRAPAKARLPVLPPKPERKKSHFPWPWAIGGAVLLAAIGGGVALALRRKKAGPGAPKARPAWLVKLINRLQRRKTAPAEDAPVEPGLDA